ncbi:hypothetical protein ASD58_26250 [Duganella sp. Root1480D1]|nr:hypothetical protein ASD58_26250 [Duganella sp. Root1480D1]
MLGLAAVGAFAGDIPDADPYDHKSAGPMVILPADTDGASDGALSMHLAGREYRSGAGWWALRCNDACELLPLSLTVSSKDHAVYDAPPMRGQLLQFSPRLQVDGVIAVLKPFRAPLDKLQLKAGPVASWVPGRECKPKKGIRREGGHIMGGELVLPGGEKFLFVPRQEPLSKAAAQAGIAPEYWLELQSGGKKQRIGEFEFDIMWGEGSTLEPSAYIRWVGDLDNDGKADFIIDTGAITKKLTLYLSSLAGPGELVGMAGSFDYLGPDEAGC